MPKKSKWNSDNALKELIKYDSCTELKAANNALYTWLLKNNRKLLKAAIVRKYRTGWDRDKANDEADKYTTMNGFRTNCCGGYGFLKRNHPGDLVTLKAHYQVLREEKKERKLRKIRGFKDEDE